MEAQGYGQPSLTMRHSNGQTCSRGCLNQSNYTLPAHPLANFSRAFAVPTEWKSLAASSAPHSYKAVLRVERVHRIGQVFVDGQWLANLSNYLVPTEAALPAPVLAGGVHRLDIVVDSYLPVVDAFEVQLDWLSEKLKDREHHFHKAFPGSQPNPHHRAMLLHALSMDSLWPGTIV